MVIYASNISGQRSFASRSPKTLRSTNGIWTQTDTIKAHLVVRFIQWKTMSWQSLIIRLIMCGPGRSSTLIDWSMIICTCFRWKIWSLSFKYAMVAIRWMRSSIFPKEEIICRLRMGVRRSWCLGWSLSL